MSPLEIKPYKFNKNQNLLSWRPILQEYSDENRSMSMLVDKVVESDEVFINAGEKGLRHSCSDDPPRVRANRSGEP